MQYSDIAIIFNPNSTGDAPGNAERLKADLIAALKDVPVTLLPTEYAGHAETLAYDFAKSHECPLVISASGDGGYNEVINGALKAENEGAKPICAVLPSGNANDHARTMQASPLLDLIVQQSIKQLDVLQFQASSAGGATKQRFAHSYIGVGLTPKVGMELNKHKLNTLQEAWILARTLRRLKPVRITVEGKTSAVDSLTCSIIPEMAKVLTLSPHAKPQDGLFEVVTLPHRAKPLLLLRLLRGAITHLGANRRTERFTFTVLQPSPVQLDGEILQLPKNTDVTITIVPGLLRTVA